MTFGTEKCRPSLFIDGLKMRLSVQRTPSESCNSLIICHLIRHLIHSDPSLVDSEFTFSRENNSETMQMFNGSGTTLSTATSETAEEGEGLFIYFSLIAMSIFSSLSSLSAEPAPPVLPPHQQEAGVYVPVAAQTGWTRDGAAIYNDYQRLLTVHGHNEIHLERISSWRLLSRLEEMSLLAGTSDLVPVETAVYTGVDPTTVVELPAEFLVPGLLIRISPGVVLPADCQLLTGSVALDPHLLGDAGFPAGSGPRVVPTAWTVGTPLTTSDLALLPLGARVTEGEGQALVLYTGENTALAERIRDGRRPLDRDLRQELRWYIIRDSTP
jgi:hypothetical protein